MKKVYADLRGKPRWFFRSVVTLAVMLFAASGTMAQGSARVNIDRKNATLPEVFEQVRRQTSLSVIYSNDDVAGIDRRDYVISNATIDQAMRQVLSGTALEYELANNVIIIRQALRTAQQAAQVTIKGRVKAQSGEPLIGATVVLVGTTQGATTDATGNFQLRVTPTGAPVLRISYIGYMTKDVTYTGEDIDVILTPRVAEMETIIVTGVFDRVADSYTGAVNIVKKEQLERVGNQNIIATLKNIDPSFQVLESNEFGSDPNRLPDIQMRGASNFSAMADRYQTSPNQPLFIVDGFETTLQKVLDMDMNRVASVVLLKDATAKALYGSRAANGVVAIETLIPQSGAMTASYTSDITVVAPDLSSYNLMNSREKLETERLAGVYKSAAGPVKQQNLDELYNKYYNEVLRGVNTYWLSVPVRTGFNHKHALFLEGGDKNMRYGVDLSYNKVNGVMKGSDRETISGGLTFQYRTGKFLFRDNLAVTFNNSNNSPYGAYSEYARLNPYWRRYDDDGSVREVLGTYSATIGSHPIYNPMINASLNTKDASSYWDITNYFSVEWNVLDELKFKGHFSLMAQRDDSEVFLPRDHTTFRNISLGDPDYFNRGKYTMGNGKMFDYKADISANYSKHFGKHVIFANVMYDMSEKSSDMIYFTAEGFANNKMDYILHAKQYQSGGSPSGTESLTRLMSVIASANYSYDERYLFDASVRRDGSSLFGKDNRWNNNWSVGAGWNVHKEKFMENQELFSRLRLRLSTGYTGSQNFQTYLAIATFKYYQESYDNIVGAYQMAMANPSLKAQRVQDNNIGLDIEMFNSALMLSVDYYVKNSKDVLTPVDMPPSIGFSSYTENLGEVKNTGIEAKLNYRIISNTERQTYLSVFASAAHNKNKLMKISNALSAFTDRNDAEKANQTTQIEYDHESYKEKATKPSVRYIEGSSMDAIWAVKSLGIDPMTGKEVFVKRDGSLTYTWDPKDQVICGDNLPKISGTFGVNFEYMGFSVNANFFFRAGGQMYNSTLVNKVENADIQYNVDRRIFTGRWNPETPGEAAKYKTFDISSRPTRPTSRFVQDFNELQMTSLNVGYDFRNLKFIRNGFLERLKVQFYCNDLFRISTIKTERGTEYPFARSFSLRIQATF